MNQRIEYREVKVINIRHKVINDFRIPDFRNGLQTCCKSLFNKGSVWSLGVPRVESGHVRASETESIGLSQRAGHRQDRRARKDVYNRKRGLRRLRKRIRSGRLSKEHLNNRGYNRFLKLTGEVTVELDEAKVTQAARWDGLKGYLTNTELSADVVMENYGQLWQIERAFRISKTDLRIRPMYHYRRRRIEAHVLVAFVAYTIYKELERRMKEAGLTMSPNRAAELTQTMYEMTFRLPNDPQDYRKLLRMDPEQQTLYDLLY